MEKRLLHLPGVAPAVYAKLLGKSRELKRSFDMRFSGGALGLVSHPSTILMSSQYTFYANMFLCFSPCASGAMSAKRNTRQFSKL